MSKPSWITSAVVGVAGAGLGYWLGKRTVTAPAGQAYPFRPSVSDVALRLRGLLASLAPYYTWGLIPRAQTIWPATCAQWLSLDPWSKWWVVSTAAIATRSFNAGPGWFTNVTYPGGVWPRAADILAWKTLPGAIDFGGYSVQALISEIDRQCLWAQQAAVVRPSIYPVQTYAIAPQFIGRLPPRGAPLAPRPVASQTSTPPSHPVSSDLFARMNVAPLAPSDVPKGFVRPG